jgi:HEAT repeat protein
VVARAAASLGLLGYGDAEARLLELAEHEVAEVRAAAVSALGRLGATDRP